MKTKVGREPRGVMVEGGDVCEHLGQKMSASGGEERPFVLTRNGEQEDDIIPRAGE